MQKKIFRVKGTSKVWPKERNNRIFKMDQTISAIFGPSKESLATASLFLLFST